MSVAYMLPARSVKHAAPVAMSTEADSFRHSNNVVPISQAIVARFAKTRAAAGLPPAEAKPLAPSGSDQHFATAVAEINAAGGNIGSALERIKASWLRLKAEIDEFKAEEAR
ncbi:MAG: hypothetical protein ACOY99_00270 [Pseudomonadota bacterium]